MAEPDAHDYWTPEDEEKLQERGLRVRALAAHASHSAEASEELKEAEKKYDNQFKQFESAESRSKLAPSIFKWLGVFTALGGFGLWFWQNHKMQNAG
ncbi:MAG: hypothetical protein IH991_15100 [Planctomycetes bacterium]|nr:hypothetical protein [Planctomycetota bacterium]